MSLLEDFASVYIKLTDLYKHMEYSACEKLSNFWILSPNGVLVSGKLPLISL
jgi:hypothetical protein